MSIGDRNREVLAEVGANAKSAVIAIWSIVIVVATVIVSRRWNASFQIDLPSIVGLLVAAIGLGFNFSAKAVFNTVSPSQNAAGNWPTATMTALVILAPPIIIGACLLPAGTVIGWFGLLTLTALGFGGLLMLDETWPVEFRGGRFQRRQIDADTPPAQEEAPSELKPEQSAALFVNESEQKLDPAAQSNVESTGEPNSRQWITRRVSGDGIESIEGACHGEFLPGQKQISLHIPFSPPFAETPELNCEVVGGEAARLKTGAIYPYGARIDVVRSSNLNEPAETQVGFYFSAPAQSQSEAA